MSLKRFETRYIKGLPYLTVTISKVLLSKSAYSLINSPGRVGIYYDEETNDIKVCNEENGSKVAINKGQIMIYARLSKVMPLGRYFFNDGVFKRESTK